MRKDFIGKANTQCHRSTQRDANAFRLLVTRQHRHLIAVHRYRDADQQRRLTQNSACAERTSLIMLYNTERRKQAWMSNNKEQDREYEINFCVVRAISAKCDLHAGNTK